MKNMLKLFVLFFVLTSMFCIANAQRVIKKRINVVIVVDTSGSMDDKVIIDSISGKKEPKYLVALDALNSVILMLS